MNRNSRIWKRRAGKIAIYLSILSFAVTLILMTFEDNIIFYYSPKDLNANLSKIQDKNIRIGGLVKETSLKKFDNSSTISFIITDYHADITVFYKGITPSLFKEGQGTVALGKLQPDGTFMAIEVLAKHDENYLPKEVIESLKESGYLKAANQIK